MDSQKLFQIPEGYEYQTHYSDESWQKVTVSWVHAKCKITGKEIVRRLLPEPTEWQEVGNGEKHKKKLKSE